MSPMVEGVRAELLALSEEQIRALMPHFVIVGGATLAILACVARWIKPAFATFWVSVVVFAAGLASLIDLWGAPPVQLFNKTMVADGFTSFFGAVFMASGLLAAFGSYRYLEREDMNHPEYYALLIFGAYGMLLMAAAQDLIVIFIALEIMSLSVYTLVGFRRADRRSNEASLKYFILGGAASAILLYGAALLYGVTGSTHLADVLEHVQKSKAALSPMFVAGAWLVIAGFLFKVASVPFHMWMPDVYEGAPVTVTGYMTTGLKAAAFAAFVRVFMAIGYGDGLSLTLNEGLRYVLAASALLTMIAGNVIALTQVNLKRMLAYSSISHTGYLLLGLIAAPRSEAGYAPILSYLVAYCLMNMGAFIALAMLAGRNDAGLNLSDLSGLSRRRPWLAFALAVFLFSMAGVPPTAGFVAKYLLFYSAVQAGEIFLVVAGVICSAISAYYYLNVIVQMYMKEPVGELEPREGAMGAALSVAAMTAATVFVGLMPAALVDAAKAAIARL